MEKLNEEVVNLILKLQEKIFAIDRKLDTLMSKVGQLQTNPQLNRAAAAQPQAQLQQPRPTVQPQPQHQPQRSLFKAVCADCRKDCEVPFKPTGDRPVYCKECFSKRKFSHNGFKPNNLPASVETKPIPAATPAVSAPEILVKKSKPAKPAKKVKTKKPASKPQVKKKK